MHGQQRTCVSGVLFSRSVRSSFAILSLAPVCNQAENRAQDDAKEQQPILVRLQFFGAVKELRSFCRRTYKLGDFLSITQGSLQEINDTTDTHWTKPKTIINVSSTDEANQQITIGQSKVWSMTECQNWQNRFFPKSVIQPMKNSKSKDTETKNFEEAQSDSNHGGVLGKRMQGEHVANFLIHAAMSKLSNLQEHQAPKDPSDWLEVDDAQYSILRKQAIEYLNSGTGVVDVAGGSGHVSMALGLAGVQSTVVDARPAVGKLPGRDRKFWNRELKKGTSSRSTPYKYCMPVVPFQTHRAWFGFRPTGVDSTFRHPDRNQEELPMCDENSDLITNASALVALHPDEATGDIASVATSRQIPFVIVPCCVFCRLFPDRRKPSNNEVVSTYQDLLEYILEKDRSIQKSQLPFGGRNTVLWSTF